MTGRGEALDPRYHGRTHKRGGTDPIGIAANMPWILMQGDLNGFTATTGSDSYPTFSGLLVSPLNAGGTIDADVYGGITTLDADIEIMTGGSSNEPFKAIKLRQPGLYYIEISSGWYLNWGGVRVNFDISHTDGFTSVVNFRNFVNGTVNSYFGGASDASAPQVEIVARNMVAVDERATDVHVRGYLHNHSGVDRTFGTNLATNAGNFSIWIIRLSDTSHSNP